MIRLSSPIAGVYGVGPALAQKLKKLGIETIKDLLWYFPFRYEDFSEVVPIADVASGQEVTVSGTVLEVDMKRTWKRHMVIVQAIIQDETGSISAVWFNQPFIKNSLIPGRRANFSGKVRSYEHELVLSNPTYEIVRDYPTFETKHTARIVPIYSETRGLTSKWLRYIIKPILDALSQVPEIIPQKILEQYEFPDTTHALKSIHFPNSYEDIALARKRFAFEDLFILHIFNLQQKLKLAQTKARAFPISIDRVKELLGQLSFELTASQKQSLWDTIQDLEKATPMNRLLQGDVGSGKTIVAVISSLLVAEQGGQVAFMAPTEILARQHFHTFKKLFPETSLGIGLLLGSGAEAYYGRELQTPLKKPALLKEIESGNIKIVIGTHALLQSSVRFQSLDLVIVDEQHRFGVEQRAKLSDHTPGLLPHFLSMSATPIPRTLNLALFGDLDLSYITELPKNRKPISTLFVPPEQRKKAYEQIRAEIKKGRQVFVVCPRIEPSDQEAQKDLYALEVKSVKDEYEKLRTQIFKEFRVGMLHGKMPAKGEFSAKDKMSKEQVMREFSLGNIDILVSTSVIEVGVDIPNATIMMIEGAERFGLAQLYQFRGRVGRGEHKSYCFLFTDSKTQSTKERLSAITTAHNGLELAEKDLAQRGPGELFGTSQTGMPDLAMKALQNPDLLKTAHTEAKDLIKHDPQLKKNPLIRERVSEFAAHIHWE